MLPTFLEFSRGAVLVAHNAGFDIGFLRAAAERCQHAVAATAGAVHGAAGPPGADPRRGAQRAAVGAGPAVRRRDHPDPPRARRRPRHRRRAARADRAGRQPGRAHLHRPAVLSARRDARPAPQAAPRRPRCRTGPACTCSAGPSDEVLYVGTAVDLRRRVGQYFTGADPRTRMQGDGVAGHRGRPRRVRARPGGGGARATAARRARAALQPPVEVSAPVVVGGADRRGVPAVLRRCGRPSTATDTRLRARSASRADAVETAALLARFTGVRTCTTRLGRSALHGPSCPERELSPCPAAADVCAARLRRCAVARRPLIEGARQPRADARLAHIADLAEPRPLRDRRAAARPRRHRHRRALARPATARAGRRRRTGRGPAGRRGRLAPRGDPARPAGRGGQRPPRRAADARRRRDLRWRTDDSAGSGATGRRARRGDRAASRAGSPSPECGSCAPKRATPHPRARRAGSRTWAASARSARVAADQLAEISYGSELLSEPHPTREQLFGSTGVDRLGGAGQARLPGRHPFGVAG